LALYLCNKAVVNSLDSAIKLFGIPINLTKQFAYLLEKNEQFFKILQDVSEKFKGFGYYLYDEFKKIFRIDEKMDEDLLKLKKEDPSLEVYSERKEHLEELLSKLKPNNAQNEQKEIEEVLKTISGDTKFIEYLGINKKDIDQLREFLDTSKVLKKPINSENDLLNEANKVIQKIIGHNPNQNMYTDYGTGDEGDKGNHLETIPQVVCNNTRFGTPEKEEKPGGSPTNPICTKLETKINQIKQQ
jgi:hypothetical protein